MPNLPALLASDQYLIAQTLTADGKTPSGAIGTGPFQVTGFNNGVLTLTANENCWQGRPFADAIEIRVHRPIRDQWLDLSVGRADVVEVPAEQLRQAQQQRLTVLVSPPVTLLALQVSDTGALANVKLRGAIAAAVDRSALYNVIFQKQGEITASLLPQRLTGYSFLFPTERDLNKAHELRGGLTTAAAHAGGGRRWHDATGCTAHCAELARGGIQCADGECGCRACGFEPAKAADRRMLILPLCWSRQCGVPGWQYRSWRRRLRRCSKWNRRI